MMVSCVENVLVFLEPWILMDVDISRALDRICKYQGYGGHGGGGYGNRGGGYGGQVPTQCSLLILANERRKKLGWLML